MRLYSIVKHLSKREVTCRGMVEAGPLYSTNLRTAAYN